MKNRFFSLACILLLLIVHLSCRKNDPLAGDMQPGIALTFDDSSVDKWVELLPMFEKYGVHATFFICNACSDNPLDKSKILQLHAAGNEIGSHTVHHTDATLYLKSNSLDDYYKNEIAPSLAYFDSINIPVTSFAYPGGDHTPASDNFLLKYFTRIRCLGLLRLAVYDSYVFHKERRIVYGAYIDRASPHSLDEFKSAIRKAQAHKAVLLLVGHTPGMDAGNPWSFAPPLLDSICNYAVQQNLKFYRMQDL